MWPTCGAVKTVFYNIELQAVTASFEQRSVAVVSSRQCAPICSCKASAVTAGHCANHLHTVQQTHP